VDHPILDDLRQVDLNATTPLAALDLVRRWQERLAEDRKKRGRG
jgi:hypothetical protein